MATTSGSARPELAGQAALMAVGRDFNAAHVLYHTVLAELMGLAPGDYRCLDLILREGTLTAGTLAQRARLTTGAVTGVVDRLERAGYVRRIRDSRDRRRVHVTTVTRSIERFAQYTEPLRAALRGLERDFDAAELETVQRYLLRLTELLRREADELSSYPASPRFP